MILAGIAFAIACYMELGKLPFDQAEAEQELQEGPLAELSGPSLAMAKLAMSMKQVGRRLVLRDLRPLGRARDRGRRRRSGRGHLPC